VAIAYFNGLLGLVPPPHPVLLSPGAALTVVLVVAALGLVDAHRRNEDLFLANLGVSRSRIVVTAAIPALVLELVVLVGGQL
jgi:lipopolysaccharide export LptBFGC system permease protein LptF